MAEPIGSRKSTSTPRDANAKLIAAASLDILPEFKRGLHTRFPPVRPRGPNGLRFSVSRHVELAARKRIAPGIAEDPDETEWGSQGVAPVSVRPKLEAIDWVSISLTAGTQVFAAVETSVERSFKRNVRAEALHGADLDVPSRSAIGSVEGVVLGIASVR